MLNPQEQRRRHTRGTAGEGGETAKEEQERGNAVMLIKVEVMPKE